MLQQSQRGGAKECAIGPTTGEIARRLPDFPRARGSYYRQFLGRTFGAAGVFSPQALMMGRRAFRGREN